MSIRLSDLPFEQFVDYIFEHPVTNPAWYQTDKGDFTFGSGKVIVQDLIDLFRQPEFLFDKYSFEQLEQGFWFVSGWLCLVRFRGLLWEKRIALELREELVRSMFELFSRFFAVNALENICFMWWDIIAYGYYMENGKPEDEDGAKIQQAMFETLRRILELDSEDCQKSALHGLGHLKHPETEKTINDFLRRYIVSRELKDYAHLCIAGTMG